MHRSGSWLTEKLFGVILYIVLRVLLRLIIVRRAASRRRLSLPMALVVLRIIIKLATTKIPLLG
ncbi:SirB2 family protein [Salmonella enterica subsp. enterica]|nr:SirB2 family protein [Salmonella enterica subsp. enterica]